MKQPIVLGLVGLLAAISAARAQPPAAAQRSPLQPPAAAPRSPSLQPAKPYRVVDLKSGSAVIDQPGNYVLNRSWSFKDLPDMPLNIIDVVADNVVLDFRGFAIDVEHMPDTAFITVIKVQAPFSPSRTRTYRYAAARKPRRCVALAPARKYRASEDLVSTQCRSPVASLSSAIRRSTPVSALVYRPREGSRTRPSVVSRAA